MSKYTFSESELNGRSHNATLGNGSSGVPQKRKGSRLALKATLSVIVVVVAVFAGWNFLRDKPRDESSRNVQEEEKSDMLNANVESGVKRVALCVGIDMVNPDSYGGSQMKLEGCVIDVLRFKDILKDAGFSTKVLENSNATWGSVQSEMLDAADILMPGDLFVMMISSHGGRHDIDGKKHECWCLYDCKVWDHEIIRTFAKFRRGVRVLLVNDQCHAGGVFIDKAALTEEMFKESERILSDPSFPMLIQFAGCRAEQSSMATSEGSTWMSSLVRALDAYPNHDCTLRQWFDKAFSDPSIRRGRQDPQWVEKGTVTDAFRNDAIMANKAGRGGAQ